MPQRICCSICDKRCRKNQKYQQCSECKNFIHQKCTNLSPRQFSCITDPQGQNPLVCDLCTVQSPTSVTNYCTNDAGNKEAGEKLYAYQNLKILNSALTSEDDLLILHMGQSAQDLPCRLRNNQKKKLCIFYIFWLKHLAKGVYFMKS